MKSASAALLALLASRQFYRADLFQFTLVGGTVLRYTSGDKDIVANGNAYAAGGTTGPYIEREGERALCRWRVGLEVDTLEFTILPGSAFVAGVDFKKAVRQGIFDGAEFQLERAIMPTYGDTAAGTIVMFVGRVGGISESRGGGVRFEINSHLELLNQPMPRNLFETGCVNTLYDAACTLNAASFAVTTTVQANSTAGALKLNLVQASGYFDFGKVVALTGLNAGHARGIRKWTSGAPGEARLLVPFPQAPNAGDSVKLYAGCDKAMATCRDKFNNLSHFRGFPFIPTPETAV